MSQNIVPINYNTCKGQIVGSNYTDFFKYNINDDINNVWNNDGVTIQASHCLFDSKSPFKYSIQNAFDGNPATSYVENTEDDLMKIDVWLGEAVEQMAIINGYASNEFLYKQLDNIIVPTRNKNVVLKKVLRLDQSQLLCLPKVFRSMSHLFQDSS